MRTLVGTLYVREDSNEDPDVREDSHGYPDVRGILMGTLMRGGL